MKRMTYTLLGLLALGAAAVPVAAQDGQPSIGDPDKGRQLFYDHGCYGCHGFNGETGARDLVGTNSPIVAEVDTFLTYLRLRGDQAPVLPSARMPSYPESALSDEDARHIFAYIRTFELDSPDVAEVPALQAIIESAERPYTP